MTVTELIAQLVQLPGELPVRAVLHPDADPAPGPARVHQATDPDGGPYACLDFR